VIILEIVYEMLFRQMVDVLGVDAHLTTLVPQNGSKIRNSQRKTGEKRFIIISYEKHFHLRHFILYV
jgi:hypothetical protein